LWLWEPTSHRAELLLELKTEGKSQRFIPLKNSVFENNNADIAPEEEDVDYVTKLSHRPVSSLGRTQGYQQRLARKPAHPVNNDYPKAPPRPPPREIIGNEPPPPLGPRTIPMRPGPRLPARQSQEQKQQQPLTPPTSPRPLTPFENLSAATPARPPARQGPPNLPPKKLILPAIETKPKSPRPLTPIANMSAAAPARPPPKLNPRKPPPLTPPSENLRFTPSPHMNAPPAPARPPVSMEGISPYESISHEAPPRPVPRIPRRRPPVPSPLPPENRRQTPSPFVNSKSAARRPEVPMESTSYKPIVHERSEDIPLPPPTPMEEEEEEQIPPPIQEAIDTNVQQKRIVHAISVTPADEIDGAVNDALAQAESDEEDIANKLRSAARRNQTTRDLTERRKRAARTREMLRRLKETNNKAEALKDLTKELDKDAEALNRVVDKIVSPSPVPTPAEFSSIAPENTLAPVASPSPVPTPAEFTSIPPENTLAPVAIRAPTSDRPIEAPDNSQAINESEPSAFERPTSELEEAIDTNAQLRQIVNALSTTPTDRELDEAIDDALKDARKEEDMHADDLLKTPSNRRYRRSALEILLKKATTKRQMLARFKASRQKRLSLQLAKKELNNNAVALEQAIEANDSSEIIDPILQAPTPVEVIEAPPTSVELTSPNELPTPPPPPSKAKIRIRRRVEEINIPPPPKIPKLEGLAPTPVPDVEIHDEEETPVPAAPTVQVINNIGPATAPTPAPEAPPTAVAPARPRRVPFKSLATPATSVESGISTTRPPRRVAFQTLAPRSNSPPAPPALPGEPPMFIDQILTSTLKYLNPSEALTLLKTYQSKIDAGQRLNSSDLAAYELLNQNVQKIEAAERLFERLMQDEPEALGEYLEKLSGSNELADKLLANAIIQHLEDENIADDDSDSDL
jgi:hypothetical protein